MRIGLVGYFDMGTSYGLGDDVFPKGEAAPEPDIGLVGINFPLGQGLLLDLCARAPELVALWRQEAVRQVARPEMETGWTGDLAVPRAEFDRRIEELAAHHPIERCELRIHAVGTVLAELRFGSGVPLPYLPGLLRCFEYAAYRPHVADELLAASARRVEAALGPELTGLVELSQRELPEAKSDARGYTERMLFSGFTHLVACVDDGDEGELAAVTDALNLRSEDVIDFEYHGKLHYGWHASLLEPNEVRGWGRPGGEGESPEEQIMRMEACIRVAHVFLGTCEAFTRLFESEIRKQVGGYVAKHAAGRSPEELNRLRTLALAVVSVTRFEGVTATEEDQTYFRKFNESADIGGKHEMIQRATEVLYNVQVAETQEKESRRQWVLSVIVGLLTSLTLISVTADAYDFIRADESLIERRAYRLLLVTLEIALIVAILVVLLTVAVRARRRDRFWGPR